MQTVEKKKIYTLNATFIGSSFVGKTCLMKRLLGKKFYENTTPTVGCLSESYYFESPKISNAKIEIKFWDTIGQEIYRSLCTVPIKKADILIIVRDKERDDLEGEKGWLKFIEDNAKIELPDKQLIFCLNKTDLIDEEEKTEIFEKLSNIAQSENYNGEVFCVSSKNSDGILNLQSRIKQFATNLVLDQINKHKYEINICLFGPSMVGKTSIISRIIKNEYMESSIATLKIIKNQYYYPDLKSHFEIKYNYYDLPGQEQYLNDCLDILKKSDILIFVNDKDILKINKELIKKKITLLNVKKIYCINKVDLLPKELKENTRKKYLKENGKNEPLFVSALSGEGIEKLKEKINEFGNEIIEERNKQNNYDETTNSVSRGKSSVNLKDIEEIIKSKKNCLDRLKELFECFQIN